MTYKNLIIRDKRLYEALRIDCKRCFGFCCVALYFSASEGFPTDKDAGKPCINLQEDFTCAVHKNLRENGLKGCTAYDCFGAGQKVARDIYGGHDWRHVPQSAKQMFDVFLIIRQLHELLWFLTEALTLQPARSLFNEICHELEETENRTHLSADLIIKLDLESHWSKVNELLIKVSELVRDDVRRGRNPAGRQKAFRRRTNLIGADLRKVDLVGANLRGACLIAADLRGIDLSGADFIGADLRDARLGGADLSGSFFLTQAQLNAAKGDFRTKLPPLLNRPAHWLTYE
jgi:uncharacterized protein YjbI with pentapeptide repeats